MKSHYIKIETFIRENGPSMYRMAFSYMKNEQDAMDVVQDSIVKALRNGATLTSEEQLKSWLYKILINTAVDKLRRDKRIEIVNPEAFDELISDADEPFEFSELEEAVDGLPLMYKHIIILRFYQDMKLKTISEVLDVNLSTVKTRLYKALNLLKRTVEETEL